MCKIVVKSFIFAIMVHLTVGQPEHCSMEVDLLSKCSMALPVLSSTEISFTLSKEELNKSCVKLDTGIKCVDDYATACMSKSEQLTFRLIYSSIADAAKDLCTPGAYQDEYLRHSTCMRTIKQEHDQCASDYAAVLTGIGAPEAIQYQVDRTISAQEKMMKTVCCAFQQYLACSDRSVQANCGDEAAQFTSTFLKKMASNIIKSFCLEYRGHECGLPDSAVGKKYSIVMIGLAVSANVLTYLTNVWIPT